MKREEEERRRDDEERRRELKYMQRLAPQSQTPTEASFDETPPTPPPTKGRAEFEQLLERRMEFVYLPEYHNLYVLPLQRMPLLLQVGKVYNGLPQPVKSRAFMNYRRDDQLEMIVRRIMPLLERAKQNIARKYISEGLGRSLRKWWVGDGRFTGYANCLYALQQVAPQQYKLIKKCVFDNDVQQHIQLTNLLHKAKKNIGGNREQVIMQLRAQEVASQVQSYQAPRRWTERPPQRRDGYRGRDRRRDDRRRDDRRRGRDRSRSPLPRRLQAERQALLKF